MQNKNITSESATMTSHAARILILSYFVALGIGAVEGADLSFLTEPFIPQPHARYFIGIVVLLLAFMVLTGMFRRPAALILSMVLFWASYLTMFSTGDLAGFWRDLALIGGLCLTAGVGEGWVSVRSPVPDEEDDQTIEPLMAPKQRGSKARPNTSRTSITRFREDLEIAREA